MSFHAWANQRGQFPSGEGFPVASWLRQSQESSSLEKYFARYRLEIVSIIPALHAFVEGQFLRRDELRPYLALLKRVAKRLQNLVVQ